MTQEWKPQSGEMCAVKVLEYDSEDGFMICEGQTPDQIVYSVPISALHPAPDPLTELERRVVETAIIEKQMRHAYENGEAADLEWETAFDALAIAVSDLLAARAPKDPVQELCDAIRSADKFINPNADHDDAVTAWNTVLRKLADLEQRESK